MKLIAAAPDLLAACLKALPVMQWDDRTARPTSDRLAAIKAVAVALAACPKQGHPPRDKGATPKSESA